MFQYFLQEVGFGNPSTQLEPPWNSLKYGKQAFLDYCKERLLKRIPRLDAAMIQTTITLSPEGPYKVEKRRIGQQVTIRDED